MAKLHWDRILRDAAATRQLWNELGHDDPDQLDEGCSINSPYGKIPLITFKYEDGQGNPASCGIESLAGKYLFFGNYCAYEDDAGPFVDFEDALGCIHDKDTIDVSQVDYVVSSTLPLNQTLEICAQHVAEGRNITINDKKYILLEGKLAESPSN